jgi:Zn-dependent protease with chaperone function
MNNLPYLVHGITLALAWFMLLNVAATAGVALISRPLTSRQRSTAPGFWLALRLAPAALSIAFAGVLFLPSYLRYEPREVEGFDISLTLLAIVALAIIGAGAVRGVLAWQRAARRTDAWMRVARPLSLPNTSMPAFAIDSETPVMALVGILRPRLLITRPVLDALTDEELRATVAHELGHSRAWDNLKRLAMRAAPDMLRATSAAYAIERRWAADSEHLADSAAGDSRDARCALASALVKVARLTPPATLSAEPISALMDGGDITARVQRLLDDGPAAVKPRSLRWLAVAVPAVAIAFAYSPLLRSIHEITEVLVNSLP